MLKRISTIFGFLAILTCVAGCYKATDTEIPIVNVPYSEEEDVAGASGNISTTLQLTSAGIKNLTFSEIGENSYALQMAETTKKDPYIYTLPTTTTLDPEQVMLEFEYKCDTPLDENLQIFYAIQGGPSEASSYKYDPLPAVDDYTKVTYYIAEFTNNGWGQYTTSRLRIDPGVYCNGSIFYIRNIVVRTMTKAEKKIYQ